MTTEAESPEPNESGFAGEGTAPEPDTERRPAEEINAERIAIPSEDLTGAISDGIDQATRGDDSDR